MQEPAEFALRQNSISPALEFSSPQCMHCTPGSFVGVAFMSGREQALFQSVEEITRLIAELHDLRMRVQRAEATALAGRHVAASKSSGDLIGRTGLKGFRLSS
jgi:hypothetical protein